MLTGPGGPGQLDILIWKSGVGQQEFDQISQMWQDLKCFIPVALRIRLFCIQSEEQGTLLNGCLQNKITKENKGMCPTI